VTNIIQAIEDERLLGHLFEDRSSWQAWLTVLRAIFGLPFDADDQQRFSEFTGRTTRRHEGYDEIWLPVGRRGGKSRIVSVIAVYLPAFTDWRKILAPGEVAPFRLVAADRAQARIVLGYVRAAILSSPLLAGEVESETQESITLRGRVAIAPFAAGRLSPPFATRLPTGGAEVAPIPTLKGFRACGLPWVASLALNFFLFSAVIP